MKREMNPSLPEESPSEIQVDSKEEEIKQLKNELAEAKDKYLRLLAEQENMRKRLGKEREQMMQYAIQSVILDFLNPIDHLESALSYQEKMTQEMQSWAEGFKMILNQFKDVLDNQGVTAFTSVGEPFDPHHHDAIEAIETEEMLPGMVIKESSKGYKMHNKTIRHARVSVSKEPEVKDQHNYSEENPDVSTEKK